METVPQSPGGAPSDPHTPVPTCLRNPGAEARLTFPCMRLGGEGYGESVLEDSDNDVIMSLLLSSCTFLLKTDTEIESVNIYVAYGFPSSATSNTGYKRIMPAGKSQLQERGGPRCSPSQYIDRNVNTSGLRGRLRSTDSMQMDATSPSHTVCLASRRQSTFIKQARHG